MHPVASATSATQAPSLRTARAEPPDFGAFAPRLKPFMSPSLSGCRKASPAVNALLVGHPHAGRDRGPSILGPPAAPSPLPSPSMPATPPPPDGPVATDTLRAAPSGAAAAPEPGDEGSATPDPVLARRHLPAPGVTPARRDPPARGPRLTAPPTGSEARSDDPGAAGNLRACNVPTSWWSGAARPAPPPPSPSPGPAVEVLLVDKATFPRDKCCGDGLTAGALRRLEALGLDPAGSRRGTPSTTWVVRSPSGREAAFALPRGQGQYAVVARRRDLDAALLDVARAAGVEVLEGHALRRRRATGRTAWSSTWRASVRCRPATPSAPTACGRRCVGFARCAPTRLPRRVARLPPVRQAGVARAGRELAVWFDDDLLPGYALVVPAARRPRQRGLRRAAHRRVDGPAQHEPHLGRPPRAALHPRLHRAEGRRRGAAPAPGPSRRASTVPPPRRGACCSWATPSRRPTR